MESADSLFLHVPLRLRDPEICISQLGFSSWKAISSLIVTFGFQSVSFVYVIHIERSIKVILSYIFLSCYLLVHALFFCP